MSTVPVLHRTYLMLLFLLAWNPIAARPLMPRIDVQCILVENARIARKSLAQEGKFGHANHGHQIATGTNTVLAIRIYDDPDRGPDSESFKKATLEFQLSPDVEVGGEVVVSVLRSYYAEGSSGWVANGGYWWAENPFPQLHFRRDRAGLHGTLKHEALANYAEKVFTRPSQTLPVDISCPVRKLAILQLTPWLGRIGTNWRSFYSSDLGE